jgi:drug/metabolite transporter (DMT)-like permease
VRKRPFAVGTSLGFASAAAFGVSTPLVQRFGRGVGPFTTAALLYAGAALVSALSGARSDAPLRGHDWKLLAFVALLGAVAAPIALAWGLQHASGVAASLLLSLEAVFTVLLARIVWHEPVGGRVALAVMALVAGGAVLVARGRSVGTTGGWGALAIVGATIAWAADNVVGRPLADRDATQVVLAKGTLGAALSAGLALAVDEPLPHWDTAACLVACGGIGYGLSLRLYLGAQRLVGAARTGSVFATAPFLGAITAWAIGQRLGGIATIVAGALCGIGVWLHMTESHDHVHTHEAQEHEHAHRHDDGHHSHPHDVYPPGEHSHAHSHERTSHSHAHAPDPHHRHGH